MNTQNIGGKASSLLKLKEISEVKVPNFTIITPSVNNHAENDLIIMNFLNDYKPARVAVRSSASNEDSKDASFAGMYQTYLDVSPDITSINKVVEKILADKNNKKKVISYYSKKRGIKTSNERIGIVIQEMISSPDFSGVMFSHDPNVVDYYYALSVTVGLGESIVGGFVQGDYYRIFRLIDTLEIQEPWIAKLVETFRTIESFYDSTSLDVEFAVKNGEVFILQCRPITTSHNCNFDLKTALILDEEINKLQSEIDGSYSNDVLGDMVDINPRELLGDNPTNLDVSIFRNLFADNIVEKVRHEMGYDPLFSGLINVIGQKPFVSLRASAFSLRPQGISMTTYDKIVNCYIDTIIKNPELQTSVEFDVYAMRIGEKLVNIVNLLEDSISENEKNIIYQSFEKIDSNIEEITRKLSSDLEKKITDYNSMIVNANNSNLDELLNLTRLGTEWFVRIARLAFYWKNRFEEKYPEENLNDLLAGHITTVSSRMQNDLFLFFQQKMDRDQIISNYGHLRPGQFKVFGESYRDDPDYYLFKTNLPKLEKENMIKLNQFKDNYEFKNTVIFLQAREELKFLFMKAFDLFSIKLKESLSNLSISENEAGCLSLDDLKVVIKNKKCNLSSDIYVNQKIILPEVIIPLKNLKLIKSTSSKPTYITQKIVKCDVAVIDVSNIKSLEAKIKDKLVVIPNADPGFDFLFHLGIKGLITRSGGPASHMCIRSIELGVPSCIGCGEDVFTKLGYVDNVILDCLNHQIVF